MTEGDRDESSRRSPVDSGSSSRNPSSGRIRDAARYLVRTTLALASLGVLLFALLHFGVAMGWLLPRALDRVLPQGWTVRLDGVEGSWLDRITVSGLSLEGPGLALSADELVIGYRLRPLLDERIEIRRLLIDGPVLDLAVADSGSAEDVGPADTTSVGSVIAMLSGESVGEWAVDVDSVEIVEGLVRLRVGREGRYHLSGLRLSGRGALGVDGLEATVDTLDAAFRSTLSTSSDSAFQSTGRLALAGSLTDGTLRLDTLRLSSDNSDVRGAGQAVFVREPRLLGAVDLEIDARPLDLRDLPLGLHQELLAHPRLSVSLDADGTPDSLRVTLELEREGTETVAGARMVVRPRAGVRDDTAGHAAAEGQVAAARSERAAFPALEGTVRFEDLGLAPWTPPPFDGLASGEVDVRLQAWSGTAPYTLRGVVRHRPVMADSSRLLGRLLEASIDIDGRLAGDADTGSPLEADVRAALRVARSETDADAGLGTVSADVRGTTAAWRVELTVDSSAVSGHGSVDWGGDEVLAVVDSLRSSRLDLRVVDSAYPNSEITGEARGRISVSSGAPLGGRAEVVLAPSSLRGLLVDTLAISSDIGGRTFQGRFMGRTEVGVAEARFRVELEDTVLRYDVDSLRYARPDSAEDMAPMAELYGRASGSWLLSERRTATLEARVDSARWTSISFTQARIDGRLDGSRIVAEVEGRTLGLAPSSLTVEASADITGLTLPEMVGSARLAAWRPDPDSTDLVDSLHIDLQAPQAGLLRLQGSAHAGEGGQVVFSGTSGASADSLRFEINADGGFPAPLSLLGGARLDSLRIGASGRRISGDWKELRSEVDVRDAGWQALTASEVMASVRLDSLGLRLDTLRVQSNVVEVLGSGSLPIGGQGGGVELRARLSDLDPVREMAGLQVLAAAGGSLQATASGSLDSLEWTTEAGVEAVVIDDIRLTGVRLNGEGSLRAPHDVFFGLSSTDVQLVLDRIVMPESEVRSLSVQAAGGADSIKVDLNAVVDARRNASARVHVEPRPERKRARIEDLRFQLDDDQWALVDDALVEYRRGVSVEPVLLRAGEQEIRVEGGVSEAGVLDLNARMDSTDIGTVADLVGFPRLRGWLSGRVRIQGTTDAPEAWVDASGAFNRPGRTPGPVDIRVRANGRRAQGSLRLRDAQGGSLGFVGGLLLPGARRGVDVIGSSDVPASAADSILLALATDSIDVTMEAQRFDLHWAEAFLTADQLASVGGTLDGSLNLRGSSDAPILEGSLQLRDGTARPTALGVGWDQLVVAVRGDGADLVVDSARIAAGSGRLVADGTIGIAGRMPLDLDVSMDDFQAIRTDAYWAVASGSLQIGGVLPAPEIDGDVRLESLDVFLDERVTSEGLEPVQLTEDDLQVLRDRFGVVPDVGPRTRPLSERITADLEVSLGRDSWLRKRTSPEMAVPFSGDMEVTLRPGEPTLLRGSVDVIENRGFVEQFGRRFQLSEGTVTFNGAPDETRVDLTATYNVPSHDNPDAAEVTIILEVAGTQEDLSLTLSSDPAMENADIVSYIATGRPASGSLTFQGEEANGGLVAAGADFALSQMTSVIESAAARRVGLDVVEIRRKGLREATLVAGKYLTPRLYVGFAQPVSLREGDGLSSGSEGQSEVEIEYEALRWLLINIEGSGSSIRFFLRGRRAY